MCILCTPRPIYRSTSRRHIGQHSVDNVGRHIGRVSVGMSTEMCRLTYRLMYQPAYRPSDGRHIDQLSADVSVDIAANTRPIRWPLIVGRISVDRRWHIGQKPRLLVYKLSAFHPFWSTLKISEGFTFSLHVPQIQSLSSKTLKWNTAKYTKNSWQERG